MRNQKGNNASSIYYQSVLSGFNHPLQQDDENSNGQKKVEVFAQQEFDWKQEKYHISVTFVIAKTGISGNQYNVEIQFDDNTNVSLSTIPNKRSKKATKQTVTIRRAKSRKKVKVPMVLRVPTEGVGTLSYPDGYSTYEGIARTYGEILGEIDRAVKRIILENGWSSGANDTNLSVQSTRSQEDLATDKKGKRSNSLRRQVRNKSLPEETARMDGNNGTLLGGRSSNDELGF
jgi:hypothetical protein